MVKTAIRLLSFLLLTVSLAGCGGGDTFRVDGTIEGLGTRNLRFYYYDGNSLQVSIASAIDGKFHFEGRSKEQTLLSVAVNQGNILGHIIVKNGDNIECRLSATNPAMVEISGNSASERFAKFITENAEIITGGDAEAINTLIENQIAAKPKDCVSSALFVIYYDSRLNPVMADSVFNMIDYDARPPQFVAGYQSMVERFTADAMNEPVAALRLFSEGDSMATFDSAKSRLSLMIFSEGPAARKLAKAALDTLSKRDGLAIVNIGLDSDTANWKQSLRDQPLKGENMWIPGSVASPRLRRLNISRIPTYIVCDSLGRQIYRGESLEAACDTVSNHL